MKKSSKVIIGAVIAVLVISVVVLSGRSDLFQGRLQIFNKFNKPVKEMKFPVFLYKYKDQIVSAVTSPVTSSVTSVVSSRVTSPAGTSIVASAVTSPVASPVASAVAFEKCKTKRCEEGILQEAKFGPMQTLTGAILKTIAASDYKQNPGKFTLQAKKDYLANPGKFTLSNVEKDKIIKLYKQKNPAQFIFNLKQVPYLK